MSTTDTPTVTVWAWTDRGDVPTRVLGFDHLPAALAEITRMRCVGTVEVEVDGERVAQGDDAADVLAQVEEHLAWAEPAEELAPLLLLTA